MKKNILENAGHGSLGHRIFCILRDKILNEEYEKGQKLNEVVLSKELNISRTPIREALKQLELEGLVKSIPNKGVYVLGFSSRDIDDMLEIRVVLESLSVQLATLSWRLVPSLSFFTIRASGYREIGGNPACSSA